MENNYGRKNQRVILQNRLGGNYSTIQEKCNCEEKHISPKTDYKEPESPVLLNNHVHFSYYLFSGVKVRNICKKKTVNIYILGVFPCILIIFILCVFMYINLCL